MLYPGDMLERCFFNQKSYTSAGSKGAARGNARPRRITVKIATAASERVIGRALSFAKPGYAKEELELLTHPSLTQNQTMLPVYWQGNIRPFAQDVLISSRAPYWRARVGNYLFGQWWGEGLCSGGVVSVE